MPYIDYRGVQLEVDEDGFIVDPSVWNEDLARFMAESVEGITELTPDHWKVIHYINDYYKRFGLAPMIRKLCKDTGFQLKYIYQLFPSGPAKGACKVAGLPKPAGCV
jgi:tRNA 2-thiouridine synthesizing protein E